MHRTLLQARDENKDEGSNEVGWTKNDNLSSQSCNEALVAGICKQTIEGENGKEAISLFIHSLIGVMKRLY